MSDAEELAGSSYVRPLSGAEFPPGLLPAAGGTGTGFICVGACITVEGALQLQSETIPCCMGIPTG